MLWHWVGFIWETSGRNTCRIWRWRKASWRKEHHGRWLLGCFLLFHLAHYVVLVQRGQADYQAESSSPQILLTFKIASSSLDPCELFDVLIQSTVTPENFFLNSLLSQMSLHPDRRGACGCTWGLGILPSEMADLGPDKELVLQS